MRLRPLFAVLALAAITSFSMPTSDVSAAGLVQSIASAKAAKAQAQEAALNVGLQEVLPLTVATSAPFAWDKLLPAWSGLHPSRIHFSIISEARADEPSGVPEVPSKGFGQALADLLTLGNMSVLAAGMAVIIFLVEALKFFPSFKYGRLASITLAVIYGILSNVVGGVPVAGAIVLALLTHNGAGSIYEALKGVGILSSSSAAKA